MSELRPVRMLYLVEDRYPPFRADVVELFARELTARGFVIDWMMRRDPKSASEPAVLDWLGQTVYLAPAVRWRGPAGRIAGALLDLWGTLKALPLAWRRRYDIVQVRDRYGVALWAFLVARCTGAKFMFWMSYPYAESKLDQARNGFVPHPTLTRLKGHVLRWLLYRAVLPLADHVFVQSERMKLDVAREGIEPGKMSVVPMGIRADEVGSAADARPPDTQRPLLLYLGILLRLRHTEMLVRVLALVRQRYPGARLRYVGEGVRPSDRQAIVDEAARLGLADAVEVTGFLPMTQAWRHVREADICFSPFYPIPVLQSTSPTKLIEYLAMAKCVVANHHPEQSRVLADSGAGQTVAWGEQEFAQAVIDRLDDPAAAMASAARGPEYVRVHRTYPVIADAVAAEYRALTTSRRCPRPGP